MIDFNELFNDSFGKTVQDKINIENKVYETRNLVIDKFKDIRFVEEGHHYFINDDEYTPVSNIIDEYIPYVDWNQKAENYARKY